MAICGRPRSVDAPYLGFVGVVVRAKEQLSDYYWTNVLDPEAPFGVLVEQNNLYDGYENHYIYLGKYIETGKDFYSFPDRKVKKIAQEFLAEIKPGFRDKIIDISVFREPYAQPILTEADQVESEVVPRFYPMSMAHIYPEDRGLNQGVAQAKKIVEMIASKDSHNS